MTCVCWHFLSVNVPLLTALSQHNIKTTTCSSINHNEFRSEFLSAETHEIWLLHYLKITETFHTKGEKMLFLSLTEDNLPNLGSPNLQAFRWSKQKHPKNPDHLCVHPTLLWLEIKYYIVYIPSANYKGRMEEIGLDLFTKL
jgi:hypothetical protein